MSSRPSRLPGSDELFRRTTAGSPPAFDSGIRVVESVPDTGVPDIARADTSHVDIPRSESALLEPVGSGASSNAERRPTGRERHDEKITVYVSSDELFDLEHARLKLKRLGLKADRGRIVRVALAELLSDLEQNGEAAVLVRRLRAE